MSEAGSIRVEVVYCPKPGQTDTTTLTLPLGATLADALRVGDFLGRHGLQEADLSLGIWGTVRPSTALLRDHDRVEIYRPLQVDPKEARRLRYRGQGRKAR